MKLISLFATLLTFQLSVMAQNNGKTIHVSTDIELIQISENAYVHISYAELPTFGRFASNGLLFVNDGKAFLFDTPVTDSLTKQLIDWISDSMKLSLVGFIPNHWHNDCMGGLGYLNKIGVESYANQRTIDMAKIKNLPVPLHGFSDSLTVNLGDKTISCFYLGAAHSMDNIVCWIPSEKILFAGCMVKDLKAQGMGNYVDGDLTEWPKTIARIISKFPSVRYVIPGHGQFGGPELLQHTSNLLSNQKEP